MARRFIVKEPDPVLHKKCKPVEKFDDKLGELLDDMRETMLYADGVGLAAPQVGILRRLAVVEVDDFYVELINPIITKAKGEQVGPEGCLSVENYHCRVKRPYEITVEYQDRYGKRQKLKTEGFVARACCHEIDHLDGILFVDRFYDDKVDAEDEVKSK